MKDQISLISFQYLNDHIDTENSVYCLLKRKDGFPDVFTLMNLQLAKY